MTDDANDDNLPFKTRAGRWLFSQGASTVLLCSILAAGGYGMWYAMTTGIPAHLQSIKDGYREVIADAMKARHEDREAFTSSLGELKSAIKENTETTRRLIESRREEQRLLNRVDGRIVPPN